MYKPNIHIPEGHEGRWSYISRDCCPTCFSENLEYIENECPDCNGCCCDERLDDTVNCLDCGTKNLSEYSSITVGREYKVYTPHQIAMRKIHTEYIEQLEKTVMYGFPRHLDEFDPNKNPFTLATMGLKNFIGGEQ